MKRFARKVPRVKRHVKKATEEYATYLRNNMTKAEALFWKVLKIRQRSWTHKFEPQVVLHGYVPDFYCPSLFLVVEIDGRVHDRKDVRRNDSLRTRRLKKHGITVIRFRNGQVFSNVNMLMCLLETACY